VMSAGGDGSEKKTRRARGKKALKQALQAAAERNGAKKSSARNDKKETAPDPKDLLHSGQEAGAEARGSGEQPRSHVGSGSSGAEGLKKREGEGGGERMPCDGCGDQLPSSKVAGDKVRFTFREHGGQKFCEKCYAMNIAPTCARCGLAIVDTITNAVGKNWHPACLTCALWYAIESEARLLAGARAVRMLRRRRGVRARLADKDALHARARICSKAQLVSTFYLQDHKPGVPYCSFCIKGVQQTASSQRTAGASGYGTLGPMTWPAQPRSGSGPPASGGAARMHNFQ